MVSGALTERGGVGGESDKNIMQHFFFFIAEQFRDSGAVDSVTPCFALGCLMEPPAAPPLMTRSLSYNYQSENGVVWYECPAGLATLKNETIQTIKCTRNYWAYYFSPKVHDCTGMIFFLFGGMASSNKFKIETNCN